MQNSIVIVGTGQGGFQLAASLRQEGCDAPITMIGEEPSLPYQRPPLSKAYMKDGEADRLLLRPAAFYEKNDINVLRGMRVDAIDRSGKTVAISGGTNVPYDHLILATGARNVVPPIRNLDAPGLFGLRTLEDAAALRVAVARSRRAVVIGGGFIGLEFAAVARAAGLEVTVVEMAPRLMARVVSPEMSRRFEQMHTQTGTRLIFGQPATEIATGPDGTAQGVQLADGTILQSDLILLASGVVPNCDLAAEAELEIDNGIAVDSQLQTSDPAISALGDCASFPDVRIGKRIRLESVQAATDQARAIAKRLTGTLAPYEALPWFWSDQGSWKLQIAGLPGDHEEIHVRDMSNGGFCAFRFSNGILTCVETVNAPGEHMAARRILAGSGPTTIRPADLIAYDLRLSRLLKERKAPAA